MRAFDQRFIDDTLVACRRLSPNTVPQWGKMTAPEMFAHIMTSLRYSLGKERLIDNEGGLFGRFIAAPLILRGILKLPKNQPAPAMYAAAPPSATLEELEVELKSFLTFYNTPGFFPPPHPYFGDIQKEGWARLHIVHLDHHLRQFGVAPEHYVSG
jgi:hypothetical protein